MITLVIGIVLIVAGIAFAAAPLLRRPSRPDHTGEGDAPQVAPPSPAAADATSGAAAARSGAHDVPPGETATWVLELEELALDKAMGKLSDGDYEALRAELLRRVSEAAPGRVSRGATPAEAGVVDEGIAQAHVADRTADRAPGRRAALDAEAEQLIDKARAATVPSCRNCGTRPEAGARYCSRCGVALGGCPGCGASVRVDGARFCDQCGAALDA